MNNFLRSVAIATALLLVLLAGPLAQAQAPAFNQALTCASEEDYYH